jgi:large subunit ribosomal protein L17
MRHRVHGRKLGRTSAHRKALFRNQLTALFTHERIITTVAKAKELRPVAERMVTLARTGTLAARRKVATMVPDDEVARRLFEDIAPRFADRPGGYTRIMRLGRRHGDNAELAIIEFVDYELSEHVETGEGGSKDSFMDRAKGMFGGGAKAAADEAEDDAPAAEAADQEDVVEEIETAEAEAVTDTEAVTETEAEAVTETEAATEPVTEAEPAETEEVKEEAVTETVDEAPAEEAPAETAADETEAVEAEEAADEEDKPKS